jgi:hypothetical protein
MYKRILLVLALSMHCLAVNAFIDGIIDNVKDQIDRRLTPFFVRLKDSTVENTAVVSNTPKKLRLKLFYKKDIVKKIRNLDPIEFQNSVNQALRIERQVGSDEFDEGLDLIFTLESAKEKSTDPAYFVANFISNEVVLNQTQAITVEFDVDYFMDEFNINLDRKDRTVEHTLKIRPISYELHKKRDYSFTAGDLADNDFQSQTLNFSIPQDHVISSIDSVQFTAYRDGRLKKSFLKQARRKFILDVNLIGDQEDILSEGFDNGAVYNFKVPMIFNLENQLKKDFLEVGKNYKALLPVLIDATSNDGLPLRIKIFSKSILSQ